MPHRTSNIGNISIGDSIARHFYARNDYLLRKSRPVPKHGCRNGCQSTFDCCEECIASDGASGERGFKHFGKLKPGSALHELYRAAITKLREATVEDCNAEPDSAYAFNLLSPFHRIQLLADLAMGLLCPNSPLPPESFAHYAALYALHNFVWVTLLDIEIDMEGDALSNVDGFPNGQYSDSYYTGQWQCRQSPFLPPPPPIKTPKRAAQAFESNAFDSSWSSAKAVSAEIEERETALRNMGVRRASRDLTEEGLAQAVAAQEKKKVAQKQECQEMDLLKISREFADYHHEVFAWPDEVYLSCGYPQTRAPPLVFHSLQLVERYAYHFAIRGLILTALREWHSNTTAAAQGCTVRLDLFEGSRRPWYEALIALGLFKAPALNLPVDHDSLLHMNKFVKPSAEKVALIKRRMFESHTAFAETWTLSDTVRAERIIIALGPGPTFGMDDDKEAFLGRYESGWVDASLFGSALLHSHCMKPKSWCELVSSDERITAACKAADELKVLWDEISELEIKGEGFEEEIAEKKKLMKELRTVEDSNWGEVHLWRRCWYNHLRGDTENMDARLEACRSLAETEDLQGRAHPLLNPLRCPCEEKNCHHFHKIDSMYSPKVWWSRNNEESWTMTVGSYFSPSQKKCWFCLGFREKRAQLANSTADDSEPGKLMTCSNCKIAKYCQRPCQVAHYQDHKEECAVLKQHRIDGTDVRHCAKCLKIEGVSGTPMLLSCSRCKETMYCNKECQVEHWKSGHKHVCRKK